MALYNLDGDGNYSNVYDESQNGGYTGQGSFSSPGTPIASGPPTSDLFNQVSKAYQDYLGRSPESNDVVNSWISGTGGDLSKILSGIQGSPEAKSYSASHATTTQSADPYAWVGQALQNVNSTDDPNYWLQKIMADPNANGSAQNYWIDRINRGNGSALVKNGTLGLFQDGGGGGYNTNGVFNDPATTAWLQLLNQRVNALNTPYQNPQLDQLNSYLQSYFQKLQGPAYTPQQLDLLQTQSLDPLTAERDAAKKRLLDQASARGLNPNSGIIQKQLSDLDQQFERLRTQTQAGFASNAVNLDRINAQQAAGVAQALANIEQTQFANNEQRANDALNIAFQVPALAQQRFQNASGLLAQNSINPTSLLQLQTQSDLAGQANTNQWLMALASLSPDIIKGLAHLFGG